MISLKHIVWNSLNLSFLWLCYADLPGGRISSLWVGIYALGPCSTTRSACQSYRADSWWRASNGGSEARKHSNSGWFFNLAWGYDGNKNPFQDSARVFFKMDVWGIEFLGPFFFHLDEVPGRPDPPGLATGTTMRHRSQKLFLQRSMSLTAGDLAWRIFFFRIQDAGCKMSEDFEDLKQSKTDSKQRSKIHLEFIAWRQHGEFLVNVVNAWSHSRPGSSFNDITGDVLLEGERIFTLSLRSGQISGSPSPFLFKDCGGDSTSQARKNIDAAWYEDRSLWYCWFMEEIPNNHSWDGVKTL